ncbi:MAG TPA: hypothetical protein VJK02_04500 [Anaerolineales bacterium]|nr:hypothetical protein [Anaerolineales bacterium]
MPRADRTSRASRASPTDGVSTLLRAISPENTNEKSRSAAFKKLLGVAKRSPATLLPRWNELTRLLRSRKAFSRYPAVHIIAALVPADRQLRFERIFNPYFSLLDDEAISVAAHVALLAGGIATARPALQSRITKRLLGIDQTHFEPGRRDLVKSYALQAFDKYIDRVTNPKAILAFAAELSQSKSPSARKAAKAFLVKWGG